MIQLPELEIEEIPMRLDGMGRPEFCLMNDEAFLADFAFRIAADSVDEWDFTSIYMGTQRLRSGSEIYRRVAQHFEADHIGKIHEHIVEHLPNEDDAAGNEAYEFAEAM